ncbi:MAG: hypothetical protein IJS45_06510 [Clostridia bacterium]|nr:hypothetical protein [Clostridia bacterium]
MKTFTFAKLPQNVAELQAMPEAQLKDPYVTAALTAAVLCHYEKNVDETIDMLNFLKGPQPLSTYEKQFLRDRLVGKGYVPRSYFAGTSPANNYEPSVPYTITVTETPYSFNEDKYALLYIKSSGADSPRQVKMRAKGDTWYLWEQFLLPDIRVPASDDPWA